MAKGILLVHYFFPDPFHLAMPSSFLISAAGRRAAIRLLRHIQGLELLDLTNAMVPDPEGKRGYVLDHEISPPQNVKHMTAAMLPKEKLEELEKSDNPIAEIPHKVTFDIREEENLYRTFSTKYFTETQISYEVSDIQNITPEDKEWYKSVMDEFVKAYRYICEDYRPRFMDDYDEPKWVQFFVVEYTREDLSRSTDELLSQAKEVALLDFQTAFRLDLQPQPFKDPNAATDDLKPFLESGKCVSTGREFLDAARHAAYHIKNFKYSLLEAFISSEYVVTKYLTDEKIRRGVSSKKLKNYDSEVTMSYKLNIELPVFLEKLTNKERQLIGNVDKVRRWRNDIVHRGKIPTEDEATFAVEAVSEFFQMLARRDIEV